MTGIILTNSKTYEKKWISNLLSSDFDVPKGINEIERKYYVDTLNPYKQPHAYLDEKIYYIIKEK